MPRRRKHLKQTSTQQQSAQQTPTQQTSTLRLPLEIILLFLKYLEPESFMSFALTCRLYYVSYFAKSPALSDKSKTALLTLLEKDIPHLMYCPECNVLHRWKQPWQSRPRSSWGVNASHECPEFALGSSGRFGHVPRHQVRLVMNRHLYGDAHGCPVEILNCNKEERVNSTHVRLKCTRQVRIIDDEIFFCVEQTARQLVGDMDKLKQFLNGRSFICSHRGLWSVARRSGECSSTSALEHQETSLPEFLAKMECGTILSCPVCLTDAQIELIWRGTQEQWSVRITTWRQFGKFRSPDDPVLQMMTDWCPKGSELRAQEHPPGAVRHRWSKGDNEVVEMEGCFTDRWKSYTASTECVVQQ